LSKEGKQATREEGEGRTGSQPEMHRPEEKGKNGPGERDFGGETLKKGGGIKKSH